VFEKQDVGLDKSLDGSVEFSRKFANLASVTQIKDLCLSILFVFGACVKGSQLFQVSA